MLKNIPMPIKRWLFMHIPGDSFFWKVNIIIYNKFFRKRQYMYFQHKNILLNNFKAIYFFIPKVACSTLKKVCAENLGYELCGKNIDQNVHSIDYPYALLDEMNTKYKGYFKFAFVRNPWDRLVSCYLNKIGSSSIHGNFIKYGLFYPNMSFENFIKAVSIIPDSISDEHFRSQSSFLLDKNGIQQVDYIGKFEIIEKDFRFVKEKLGLKASSLPHLKKSSKRAIAYREYYTNETQKLVGFRYGTDISLFGYSF